MAEKAKQKIRPLTEGLTKGNVRNTGYSRRGPAPNTSPRNLITHNPKPQAATRTASRSSSQ